MSKINQLLLLWLLCLPTFAQEPPTTHQLSAAQAVEMALKNTAELQNLRKDVSLQQLKNKEIEGSAMPQITGSVAMNHFFNIPVTLLPDFISPQVYGVLEKEKVQNGQTGQPITNPNKEPQFFPAQFGVPWTMSAGFSIQQLLFQPDVFVGLKARKTAINYANQTVRVSEDKVIEAVQKYYNNILVSQKRLALLQQSIDRITKLEHDTKQLYINGFAEKLDVDKVTVALNNLKSSETQIKNGIDISLAVLKQAIGVSQKDQIVLTEQLDEATLKGNLLDLLEGFKYEDRNEIKLLNLAQELQKLDIQRYKLAYFPTVAAFWNVQESAQRQRFNFFKSGSNYPWFNSSIVGISVNVPLFDGFQRKRKIQQAALNLEKTQVTEKGMKSLIDMEQEVAKKTFINALLNVDAQNRNIQLAESVYNTTKLKFEQGLGSSFEVITAQNELTTAQDQYLQALLDAVNAKVGLLKSIGKLLNK